MIVGDLSKTDHLRFEKDLDACIGKLKAYVFHSIDCSADAEDVLQEILVNAWRGYQSFRSESLFYTWIYRIAQNTLKNYYLKKKRENTLKNQECLNRYEHDCLFNDQLEQLSRVESIEQASKNIPKSYTKCLYLRAIVGLSYAEIASQLKCPIGTVRSRINRARHLLSKEFS